MSEGTPMQGDQELIARSIKVIEASQAIQEEPEDRRTARHEGTRSSFAAFDDSWWKDAPERTKIVESITPTGLARLEFLFARHLPGTRTVNPCGDSFAVGIQDMLEKTRRNPIQNLLRCRRLCGTCRGNAIVRLEKLAGRLTVREIEPEADGHLEGGRGEITATEIQNRFRVGSSTLNGWTTRTKNPLREVRRNEANERIFLLAEVLPFVKGLKAHRDARRRNERARDELARSERKRK
jgi:hypothetical protein